MALPATAERDDLLALFDHVWQRFTARMNGLGDEEWAWQPGPDARLTLRWRLAHIAALLAEDRNGPWLGLDPGGRPAPAPGPPEAGAAGALATAGGAFAHWRTLLAATGDAALAAPVGAPAGRYGDATRRSFALHIADELIHHTAEAALLRDLYGACG